MGAPLCRDQGRRPFRERAVTGACCSADAGARNLPANPDAFDLPFLGKRVGRDGQQRRLPKSNPGAEVGNIDIGIVRPALSGSGGGAITPVYCREEVGQFQSTVLGIVPRNENVSAELAVSVPDLAV